MKIIAFGASTSKTSINKMLASYAGSLLEGVELEILDLNDYDLPLFSVDKEKELGKPQLALDFLAKIEGADGVIISFAEHNGNFAAAYKNIFDWVSRAKQKVYAGKKVLLLSTSPGPGGAKNVLALAVNSMPYFGAEVVGHFSLPSFNENFDVNAGEIVNHDLKKELAF